MLDAKVSKLLNEQITKELYSAYLYLDFSVFYEAQGLLPQKIGMELIL